MLLALERSAALHGGLGRDLSIGWLGVPDLKRCVHGTSGCHEVVQC